MLLNILFFLMIKSIFLSNKTMRKIVSKQFTFMKRFDFCNRFPYVTCASIASHLDLPFSRHFKYIMCDQVALGGSVSIEI
jgi:hypothetical protein